MLTSSTALRINCPRLLAKSSTPRPWISYVDHFAREGDTYFKILLPTGTFVFLGILTSESVDWGHAPSLRYIKGVESGRMDCNFHPALDANCS